ncbi:MAG: DUF6125 family protein [Candidatus Hodarchaeales archaeon]
MNLEEMTKPDLIKLVKMYAVNWLAHDGCWFLAAEEKYGLNEAIEIDKRSWINFTRIEAKRIMKSFNIAQNGGLGALKQALGYRLYATVNEQEIIETEESNSFIFQMVNCRVQNARERKQLPDFPCKPVGIEEYSGFAGTIDPRISTECLSCPPDPHPKDYYCSWKFSLKEQRPNRST